MIFSYFSGPCTKKLAAIRTSNVSDLTNQRACRSLFGRTRFPHLCSLLHAPWSLDDGYGHIYIYLKRILCDLVFDSSVERCFTGRLSKSNQSTDFKISVQSIVVHLAVFACCKPPINRQLCLVRVASSASFNPNLEHFWVNGRIVCPE